MSRASRPLKVRCISVETASSTNDLVRELFESEDELLIVSTMDQYGGRGKGDRRWVSATGKALAISFMLKEPRLVPITGYTAAAALAVCKTLKGFGLNPGIKWSNDVLVRGKKLSGILCESIFEGERVSFVIIGIGVNLNQDECDFIPELRGIAGSVRTESGEEIDPNGFSVELISEILELISRAESGHGIPLNEIEEYSLLKGKRISISVNGVEVNGKVMGIDESNALLLESGGEQLRVVSGDILYR